MVLELITVWAHTAQRSNHQSTPVLISSTTAYQATSFGSQSQSPCAKGTEWKHTVVEMWGKQCLKYEPCMCQVSTYSYVDLSL